MTVRVRVRVRARVRARPNLVVGLGHPVAVLARRRLRVDHRDGFLSRTSSNVPRHAPGIQQPILHRRAQIRDGQMLRVVLVRVRSRARIRVMVRVRVRVRVRLRLRLRLRLRVRVRVGVGAHHHFPEEDALAGPLEWLAADLVTDLVRVRVRVSVRVRVRGVTTVSSSGSLTW